MSRRNEQKPVQLTIRGVPARVKDMLVHRAEKEKKSLNSVLLDLLCTATETSSKITFHDLDELAGSWVEDPEFEAIIEEQDRIDEDMWK